MRRINLRPRAPEISPQPTAEASPGPARASLRFPKRAFGIVVAALVVTLIGVTISTSLVDYASGPNLADGSTGGNTDLSADTPADVALGDQSATSYPGPDETLPWAMPGSSSPGGEAFGTSPSPDPTATPAPTKVSATPRPTQKPAPKPTAVQKPKPKPTYTRPAGISVPSSIDSTGKRDVTAALNAFIGRAKNGSTIVFRRGGVYRLSGPVKFAHRHNLTLNGNGATLRSYGPATESGSLFWLGSYGGPNTGITIKNFRLVGNSSSPGVYRSGREGAAGVLVDTGSHINIYGLTVSGVWGDCLKVNSWASYISFHDSNCSSVGRNGVTIIAGSHVTVQHVRFGRSGYNTFDIEANHSNEGARSIRFVSNTAGTWTNAFFSANGASGSVVSGVTISGNRITGDTLLTVVTISRRKNIVFTNNTSTVRGRGPILRFAHIDGLTVRGNHQPLSSGTLVSIADCTSVHR